MEYKLTSRKRLFITFKILHKNIDFYQNQHESVLIQIQLNTDKILKNKAANGMGYRNAVTKSYKYIGPSGTDNTNVITFNADVWKDVAQNQIQMF